eukprot:6185519-Pleurochrysis_carterae.AAC.2
MHVVCTAKFDQRERQVAAMPVALNHDGVVRGKVREEQANDSLHVEQAEVVLHASIFVRHVECRHRLSRRGIKKRSEGNRRKLIWLHGEALEDRRAREAPCPMPCCLGRLSLTTRPCVRPPRAASRRVLFCR